MRWNAAGQRADTNSIESFWSLFKRGIVGQYHHISRKWTQAYVDESANRFNYSRNNNGVGYWRVVLGSALNGAPMLLMARWNQVGPAS